MSSSSGMYSLPQAIDIGSAGDLIVGTAAMLLGSRGQGRSKAQDGQGYGQAFQ